MVFWPSSVPDSLDQPQEIRVGSTTPVEPEAPPPAPEPAPAPTQEVAPVDEPTGLVSERGLGGEEPLPPVRFIPELPPVNFGFDSYDVTAEVKAALRPHVAFLKANPGLMVVLRGHTDQQGSEEYNIALGARRAAAVRGELIAQGLDAKRLTTISFGKALPLVPGSSPAASAQNRRVEFFIYELEKPAASPAAPSDAAPPPVSP